MMNSDERKIAISKSHLLTEKALGNEIRWLQAKPDTPAEIAVNSSYFLFKDSYSASQSARKAWDIIILTALAINKTYVKQMCRQTYTADCLNVCQLYGVSW